MKLKKLVRNILIGMMVLFFTAGGSTRANAEEEVFTCGDFRYTKLDASTCTLYNYIGAGGDVVVPASLDGYSVRIIGRYAFTEKGENSWRSRHDITRIELPNGVKEIDRDSFWGCAKMTELVLPDSIEIIGMGAFDGCKSLTSVKFPTKMESVPNSCFRDCESLTEVDLPEGIISIGMYAFDNCRALEEIELPNSLETISENAFRNCISLKSFHVPDRLRYYSYNDVFSGCPKLVSFSVSSKNKYYKVKNGMLYSADGHILALVPRNYEGEFTVFDSEVTAIGSAAFSSCEKLTGVYIPKRVTSIGKAAFYRCTELEYCILPNQLTVLNDDLFYECKKLKSIHIPDSVTELKNAAFQNCSSLTEITIPRNVEFIDYSVFSGDVQLTEIRYMGSEKKWDQVRKLDSMLDPKNSYSKKVKCLGYTSLTSASGTPNGIMLKFTLPKEGKVVIYRSTAENSGFTRIGTAQKTTYLDISAKSGVLYYYKVRYEYDNHLSGSDAAKKAAILFMPQFTKTVNTVSGVHIYWKDASLPSGAQFRVYRSAKKSGGYTQIATTRYTDYTDKNVKSGSTYYYKVILYFGGITSEASAATSIQFLDTPDLTSRANTVDGIRIRWNNIAGAGGYAVYRKGNAAGAKWARVATLDNETLLWTDKNVKNGSGYHYTVRALGSIDNETLSGCRSTGRTMVRLNKPVIYSMEKKGAGTVLGTWSRNDKAMGYEVRFMVGTEVYKTFVYSNNATVKKTISGLPTGKTYKIQVRSYYTTKSAGTYYSSWSDAVNVKL